MSKISIQNAIDRIAKVAKSLFNKIISRADNNEADIGELNKGNFNVDGINVISIFENNHLESISNQYGKLKIEEISGDLKYSFINKNNDTFLELISPNQGQTSFTIQNPRSYANIMGTDTGIIFISTGINKSISSTEILTNNNLGDRLNKQITIGHNTSFNIIDETNESKIHLYNTQYGSLTIEKNKSVTIINHGTDGNIKGMIELTEDGKLFAKHGLLDREEIAFKSDITNKSWNQITDFATREFNDTDIGKQIRVKTSTNDVYVMFLSRTWDGEHYFSGVPNNWGDGDPNHWTMSIPFFSKNMDANNVRIFSLFDKTSTNQSITKFEIYE